MESGQTNQDTQTHRHTRTPHTHTRTHTTHTHDHGTHSHTCIISPPLAGSVCVRASVYSGRGSACSAGDKAVLNRWLAALRSLDNSDLVSLLYPRERQEERQCKGMQSSYKHILTVLPGVLRIKGRN